ncbi:hypothetical protein [Stenotrophomonas pigmentata]|uniref:hypothetical protein n=1 Tax=Stenotrophomonas pigmentata TaxID=3055080 RepID=UPI0026ECDD48|nr:hypothetical protein [Stenotrophomonas sp. 610A2]
MRAMRVLAGLALLLAMLGWTAWFVICNVYEFSLALDPVAFACGWVLSAVLVWRVFRRVAWPMFALATCIGVYLLLIHRGMGETTALALFVAASVAIVAAAFRATPRARAA